MKTKTRKQMVIQHEGQQEISLARTIAYHFIGHRMSILAYNLADLTRIPISCWVQKENYVTLAMQLIHSLG